MPKVILTESGGEIVVLHYKLPVESRPTDPLVAHEHPTSAGEGRAGAEWERDTAPEEVFPESLQIHRKREAGLSE